MPGRIRFPGMPCGLDALLPRGAGPAAIRIKFPAVRVLAGAPVAAQTGTAHLGTQGVRHEPSCPDLAEHTVKLGSERPDVVPRSAGLDDLKLWMSIFEHHIEVHVFRIAAAGEPHAFPVEGHLRRLGCLFICPAAGRRFEVVQFAVGGVYVQDGPHWDVQFWKEQVLFVFHKNRLYAPGDFPAVEVRQPGCHVQALSQKLLRILALLRCEIDAIVSDGPYEFLYCGVLQDIGRQTRTALDLLPEIYLRGLVHGLADMGGRADRDDVSFNILPAPHFGAAGEPGELRGGEMIDHACPP